MNIILIPHLPKYSTRGFQLAKHLGAHNNVVFIIWSMPFPLTFSNLLDNLLNSWKSSEIKKEGITVYKIKRMPFFFPLINKWWFKKQIRKIYRSKKIDVIVSESYFNEVEPPLNLPIIYDLVDDHEAFIEIYGSHIYKFGCRILEVKKTISNQIQASKKITVVSDLLTNYISKFNKESEKIPNGVTKLFLDYNKIDNTYVKHSVVYVSNFDLFCNVPNVILAINVLSKKYKDVKLVLVGDGLEIPIAKLLTAKLQLEEFIEFKGWVKHELVPEIISKSEVSLLPFKIDRLTDSSFPIKIMEYLAAGIKIVSSGLSEVIKLESPNLTICENPEDPNTIAKAIELSFSKKYVPNINNRIAGEYDWEKISSKLQLVINKII